MPKQDFAKLNDWVMKAVYAPFMLIIAHYESRMAKKVRANRARGEEDDDETEEWEELQGELDILGDGWSEQVESGVPDVDKDPAVIEVLKLRAELQELKDLVSAIAGKETAAPTAVAAAESSSDESDGPTAAE